MLRSPRVAGLLVTVLVAGGVAASTADTSSAAATSSATVDTRLDRALTALVGRPDGPPGVAVVVQRADGDPVLHQAGTAVVATDTPIAATDHVRLASVAKAFSGAAALSVVASGELTLDSTVGKVLPTLPSAWSAVTLRQLLQHTSGIPDFSQTLAFRDALTASLQDPPPPAQLLSYVASDPLEFKPGSKYHYSNSDNIAIGLMVEAATGHAYADELRDRVFTPLGLTATSLPEGSALPDPFVHGYALEDAAPPDDVSSLFAAGWSWASGGIVSTPADANQFVRGYASGKTTNSATRTAQRTFVAGTSEPPGPGRNAAGLAIFRYRTRCGTVYGHTGNTAGFTQFIAATGDGTQSVSVSVNAQITPKANPVRFVELRRIFELAVCAATSS